MLIPGLVSVTFRRLSPEDLIRLVAQSGLKAIEWGGDVHVPPSDESHARLIARQTRDAGLAVGSYGSYYRATSISEFDPVLACAVALGTRVIRVWAGTTGSAACSTEERQTVVECLRHSANSAARVGCQVSLEYHSGTLTDTLASTLRLLQECGLPSAALGCHWQPRIGATAMEATNELRALLPWLTHLHVFHWREYERFGLADGVAAWNDYFAAAQTTGRDHGALMEFVRNDSPEQFRQDAATLLGLVKTQKLPADN